MLTRDFSSKAKDVEKGYKNLDNCFIRLTAQFRRRGKSRLKLIRGNKVPKTS